MFEIFREDNFWFNILDTNFSKERKTETYSKSSYIFCILKGKKVLYTTNIKKNIFFSIRRGKFDRYTRVFRLSINPVIDKLPKYVLSGSLSVVKLLFKTLLFEVYGIHLNLSARGVQIVYSKGYTRSSTIFAPKYVLAEAMHLFYQRKSISCCWIKQISISIFKFTGLATAQNLNHSLRTVV